MTPRGMAIHNLIIRLAAEGVPIGAIARATQREVDYVGAVVAGAVAATRIAAAPADDWSAASGPREPEIEAAALAVIEAKAIELRTWLGFNRGPSRLIAALLVNGSADRPSLARIITDHHANHKLIDVVACEARRKLKAFDITFLTVWGTGYRMDEANRQRLRELLADAKPPRRVSVGADEVRDVA